MIPESLQPLPVKSRVLANYQGVAAAQTLNVPNNPSRHSIFFGCTAQMTIAIGGVSLLSAAISPTGFTHGVLLTYDQWGSMVCSEMNVVTAGAATGFLAFETFTRNPPEDTE